MHSHIDSILDEAAGPVSLSVLLSLLADRESRPVDCQVVEESLRANPLAAEVERALWVKASTIINGRSFFAIPEVEDVRAGRVCCVGSDLFFMMRLGARQGAVTLVTEDGQEIQSRLLVEDTGYFYLEGLDDWYRQTGFAAERDSLLVRCLDYDEVRYAIVRLEEPVLDGFVGSRMRTSICTWLVSQVKREPGRFPGTLPNGFSISGALRFLLHARGSFFERYPCNLSFFMSLDERFLVTGNQFILRSESQTEDFVEHYIGQESSLLFEPQDIARFNRALEALFELGDAATARDLFMQLAAEYPQEMLLHKYIYQAAWHLEDFEAVRRHVAIYLERFPRDPDAVCTLAEVAMFEGEYDKSAELLAQAETLVHPNDKTMLADVCIVRMRLLWETHDDEGAARVAQRLLELEPDNEEALALLEDHPLPEGKTKRAGVIKADFARKKTIETGEQDE